eukprot:Phypoly_transcript_21813.p1 GENE.Phypoly_transcript_21813~~Phypoly_transcript_21813.p1  ORF type:complete len:164 (+),score=18.20 Phypoly_transcript_21813:126-617(+)
MDIKLLLVLCSVSSLLFLVRAQTEQVQIYAANTLGLVCGTPSQFMPFNVTNMEYSSLWGSCNNQVIYSPANQSLEFECSAGLAGCQPYSSNSKISYSLGYVPLEKLNATGCVISFFTSSNQPSSLSNFCYAEWICLAPPSNALLTSKPHIFLENTRITTSKLV